MNTSQKFIIQTATVGGLLGGMVIALLISKDYQKAKTYGIVLGTLGAVVGYEFAKKTTENVQ